MYTGLVIEELLALVERAEEHARNSRESFDCAEETALAVRAEWMFLNENTLLAGVA